MSHQDTLPAGTVINGEYQIVRGLGSGGFANTYLARELSLQRMVAIKEYFPREVAIRTNGTAVSAKSNQAMKDYMWGLKRFTEEARIIARFRHPNIVRVYRVLDAHNTAYIVLDYVDGSDLEVWLKRRRERERPQQSEFDGLLAGMIEALGWIHRDKVLHRDIKPANIYIRAVDGIPVLLDFGASKFDFGEKTGTTAAIVSRGYSPQEAYATDARMQGPWTDVYGLAATIYFGLTGRPPPEATERVLRDEMIPAASLALQGFRPGFLEAVDWGLRVQPAHRPQSVAQWAPCLFHGVKPPPLPRGVTQTRFQPAPGHSQASGQAPGHPPHSQSHLSQRAPSGHPSPYPSGPHAPSAYAGSHPAPGSSRVAPQPLPGTVLRPPSGPIGAPSRQGPPQSQPMPPPASMRARSAPLPPTAYAGSAAVALPAGYPASARVGGASTSQHLSAPLPPGMSYQQGMSYPPGWPPPRARRARWPYALAAVTLVFSATGSAAYYWRQQLFGPRGPLSAIWSLPPQPDRGRGGRDRDYGGPSYSPPPYRSPSDDYSPPAPRARPPSSPPPSYDPPPRPRPARAEPDPPPRSSPPAARPSPPPARAVESPPPRAPTGGAGPIGVPQ